ncbi:hypothetical protein VKT23_001262 [Stygiomarasmius scandens]|uniref:Uncharacterized protein n=1 Tax=Marasmiellus scandens TaxID=2682957 RepID=A0ABR1KBZ2_9AGAR
MLAIASLDSNRVPSTFDMVQLEVLVQQRLENELHHLPPLDKKYVMPPNTNYTVGAGFDAYKVLLRYTRQYIDAKGHSVQPALMLFRISERHLLNSDRVMRQLALKCTTKDDPCAFLAWTAWLYHIKGKVFLQVMDQVLGQLISGVESSFTIYKARLQRQEHEGHIFNSFPNPPPFIPAVPTPRPSTISKPVPRARTPAYSPSRRNTMLMKNTTYPSASPSPRSRGLRRSGRLSGGVLPISGPASSIPVPCTPHRNSLPVNVPSTPLRISKPVSHTAYPPSRPYEVYPKNTTYPMASPFLRSRGLRQSTRLSDGKPLRRSTRLSGRTSIVAPESPLSSSSALISSGALLPSASGVFAASHRQTVRVKNVTKDSVYPAPADTNVSITDRINVTAQRAVPKRQQKSSSPSPRRVRHPAHRPNGLPALSSVGRSSSPFMGSISIIKKTLLGSVKVRRSGRLSGTLPAPPTSISKSIPATGSARRRPKLSVPASLPLRRSPRFSSSGSAPSNGTSPSASDDFAIPLSGTGLLTSAEDGVSSARPRGVPRNRP